jgi:GDPmannose 4,6-dehydratase
MLQHAVPRDFVIATGEQRSVRDFANVTAAHMGIELEWRGQGVDEHAVVMSSKRAELQFHGGDVVIRIDPRYHRPAEVDTLLGDPSLARELLGWKATTPFDRLVGEMSENDLRLAREEALIQEHRNGQ